MRTALGTFPANLPLIAWSSAKSLDSNIMQQLIKFLIEMQCSFLVPFRALLNAAGVAAAIARCA